MKKLVIFFVILILLIGGLYYFFPLERVVKQLVNKYGSQVTDTSVNLSGFNIDLQNGHASVKGITVANPKNYKTKYAIQLGNISVNVDLRSLTTDTIVIKEIKVNEPIVSYEMMSLTKNNISDLIENINKYTSSSPAEKETVSQEESSKKVIIKQVVISNGKINGAMTAAPDVISASVPLPTITMNNIGQSSNGMTIADSIAFILNKLLSAVSTTVISSNLANLKDAANATLDTAKDAVTGAVDAVKDTTGSVVGGVTDTLSGLNPFGK